MSIIFQEIIQDALDERIELLKLDIPTRKRGRVSKKKPAVKDVVAVEDSDDEDFFENISDEKYIKTKEQKKLFEYSEKGWIPVNITNSDITSSTI